MAINPNNQIFKEVLEQYKQTKIFGSSRIRQDLVKEQSVSADYKGRELYELIQNAEDANSEYVDIRLEKTSDKCCLTVSNGGPNCESFTENGYSSIMMADMSPKMISKQQYIGCKGLGFRSLVNWAEEISITSGGVRCDFSREIAKQYWDTKINLPQELKDEHVDFARKQYGFDCPVAMLAIPCVKAKNVDMPSSECKTQIEIVCKMSCYDSIKEQIDNLSGIVLLFLKHLKEIRINIDGDQYKIAKGNKETVRENISKIETTDQKAQIEWLVYRKNGEIALTSEKETVREHAVTKKYEIALAYDAKNAGESNRVFSFFPTNVFLHLPFVLHATFDLNSSRNAINQTEANTIVQKEIANSIVDFAQILAERSSQSNSETTWKYFDFLNMMNDGDCHEFPILAEILNNIKKDAKVYPAVSKQYYRLADTVHYSEEMAQYILNDSLALSNSLFSTHLIPDFQKKGISPLTGDESLYEQVNLLSQQIQGIVDENERLEARTRLICAISSVKNCQPMKILVDDKGTIIEDNAKINVGESLSDLPSDMRIIYVSNTLVNELKNAFGVSSERSVTERLRINQSAEVSNLDINSVKRTIISYTKDMDTNGYTQLMYALFKNREKVGSDDFKKVFRNPGFWVFDKNESRVHPKQVVVEDEKCDYDSQYLMLYSLEKWKQTFEQKSGENQDKKEIKEFFINTIGISVSVPMKYVEINSTANSYLQEYCFGTTDKSKYYSTLLEHNQSFDVYNRFGIVEENFIQHLIGKGKSLCDVIQILCKDREFVKQLKRKGIYYHYVNYKYEEVDLSYSAYTLRSCKALIPLRNYVLSERLSLTADDDFVKGLNSLVDKGGVEFSSLLVLMGARERLSDLTIDELYDVLELLPDKKLTSGVQRLYKAIREAILSQKDNLTRFQIRAQQFAKNGMVYARKKGGDLEVVSVADAYYWDNDQLPKQILNTKYKLEIGNRIGENSVRDIFGVNLAKDIELSIDSAKSNCNDYLSSQLQQWLQERFRFILAYRFRDIKKDDERKNFASALRNMYFKIYSSATFSTNDITSQQMNDGDMISTDQGKVFHICTKATAIEDAINNPLLCENITEAICIVLKVTGIDMANCFRSIIKTSKEENKYFCGKDISEEEWRNVDQALGISEEERSFWSLVFEKSNKKLDESQMIMGSSAKVKYLRESFHNITIPDTMLDVADLSGKEQYELLLSLGVNELDDNRLCLDEFYLDWMRGQRDKYIGKYASYLYDKICKEDDSENHIRPDKYFEERSRFGSDWFADGVASGKQKVIRPEEMRSWFEELFNKKFNIDLSQLDSCKDEIPCPKSEYLAVLEKYGIELTHLDQKEVCIMCFDGYENRFEDIIKKYKSTNQPSIQPAETKTVSIKFGVGINVPPVTNTSNGSGPHGGYTSERAKIRAGKEAEKLVFESMKNAPSQFAEVIGVSRNLDPTNGDDNKHYDISYHPVENGIVGGTRYLEVKSMKGSSIIMSALEYQFATQYSNQYDLAIVCNEDVTIIKNAFSADGSIQPLIAHADTYKISLNVEPEKK